MPIDFIQFVLVLLILIYNSGPTTATVSIYSASVNPPDSPYSYLLSGNTIFDTVYSTFNSTGVLAIGGILFAAGGKKNFEIHLLNTAFIIAYTKSRSF